MVQILVFFPESRAYPQNGVKQIAFVITAVSLDVELKDFKHFGKNGGEDGS